MNVSNASLIDSILPILNTLGKTCSGFFRKTTDLTTQAQGYAYGFTAYRIHENVIRVMANRVYSGIVELYDYETDKSAWSYKGSLLSDLQQAPTSMATTRTENPYVSETAFGRVNAKKIGPNLLWVEFNVTIDNTPLPKTSDFIKIGKINGISYVQYGIYIDIPAQNGSGVICLAFQDDGILKILNSNEISQGSVSGFVRTSFVAVVNFS